MDERFFITWEIKMSAAGKLIREFLKEQGISKTALTDIKFRGGDILINGETVNVRYRLQDSDVLTLIFPKEEPSEGIIPEHLPLSIVYEDPYVLIINKPSGMSTIPSREHPSGSLANGLLGYYEQIGLSATAHIVTRLDRDTSGLVLVAKHRHVHHLLSELQKQGRVKRIYEALASGLFEDDFGKIVQPIARKQTSIIEREVHPSGQYACTNYWVLSRKESKGFTHVKLQLETGRTHQIRVHLSFLGHPLLGDDMYGGPLQLISRQALHCREVSFYHPFLEEECFFTTPLPEDMQQVLL
ncbi:RluA family pseudouridine synthase [Bacillus sp. DNRA2]|uniref:RluA family pseudouridine synthase n=1 Tax=Bacillus sp. DNRA2 TaxID=2723053 RepID=UPI00145D1F9E|nr:RluA family pseudouridine synthase [Bacillus sp. DNRA2]NMD71507.1 RluA family pseudouridine synthase [Bacillus sp. DNRA2]